MFPLIWSLLKPYRSSLVIILAAMLVQTAMSVATPWPLKIVLDNVVGVHKLPHWLDDFLRPFMSGGTKMQIAAAAAITTILIALLGAAASYVANYYTTSVGQWVANDLRLRTYHHLQQLSLNYYNTHEMGTLLSTMTADVQTIQNFASSSTLGILGRYVHDRGHAGHHVLAQLGFHLDRCGCHPVHVADGFAIQESGEESDA